MGLKERAVVELNAYTGSITEAERRFVEEWESVSDSQNFVIREDRRGDEQYHLVTGNQRFKITTYERILTQDKIKDLSLDPFKNGCFRPILVPDNVSVKSNPNALSEEDIQRIFVSSDIAWNEYMAVIDSPATLRRMIELAENTDLPLRRFRELEEKAESAIPAKRVEQKDQDQFDSMGPVGTPTGSAPSNSAPPKPLKRVSGAS